MNKSKAKGSRFERECLQIAQNHGFTGERAYGSNGRALGESETVDLVIYANGDKVKVQCKVRKKIAKYIHIPKDCDVTILKEDRGEIYVVQRYNDWLKEVGGGIL